MAVDHLQNGLQHRVAIRTFGNTITYLYPMWRAHSCVPRRVSDLLKSWNHAEPEYWPGLPPFGAKFFLIPKSPKSTQEWIRKTRKQTPVAVLISLDICPLLITVRTDPLTGL